MSNDIIGLFVSYLYAGALLVIGEVQIGRAHV